MEGHTDSVTCLATDGEMIFSGGDDNTIRVWNSREWYHDGHKGKKKGEIKITHQDKLICPEIKEEIEEIEENGEIKEKKKITMIGHEECKYSEF